MGNQLARLPFQLLGGDFKLISFEQATVIIIVFFGFLMIYFAWFGFLKLLDRRAKEEMEDLSIGWHHYHTNKPVGSKVGEVLLEGKDLFINAWVNFREVFTFFLVSPFKPSKKKLVIVSVLFLLAFGLYVFHYFFTRPWVSYQSPTAGEPWYDHTKPLTVIFDKPVNTATLKLNMAPQVPGTIEWIPSFPTLGETLQLYRGLKFYPNQSFLPDQEVVVYLVDIQSLTGSDGIHEHNVALTGPTTPEIKSFTPNDGQKDVLTDTKVDVYFTHPNGDFVEWKYSAEPDVALVVKTVTPWHHQLVFSQELTQSTSYKITAERSLIEKDLSSNQILSRYEFQKAGQIGFETVKTPLIKSIEPSGPSVLPNAILQIKFDLAMNTRSVEQHMQITPEVQGAMTWQDAASLTFTPNTNWEKDTEYVVVIAKGAESEKGGEIESKIKHKFKTIGAVQVVGISPASNTSTASVSSNIEITFDQPVDHASAQSLFSISPSVSGDHSWQDNKMVFNPKSNLAYGKTYTVTVRKGVKSVYGDDSTSDFTSKFTTPPESFSLNVPWYVQGYRYNCNVAATRMVLAYYGIYQSENTIRNGFGIGQALNVDAGTGGNPYNDWIDGYGTYWTTASSYISKYRKTAIRQGWNIPDMLKEVRNGNPVILWWQNGWGSWYWKNWTTPEGTPISGLNGMHSEVVIGYKGDINNPTTIIVRDPWRGTRYLSKSYFDNLWKNSFNRTGVVVY